MPETIPVRVRDCACPDLPHAEGDVVLIRAKLSLEGGLAAQQDLTAASSNVDELTRRWLMTFVRFGAEGWNLLDEAGQPVPFNVTTILDDFELASPVAEACNERYAEVLLRPLGLTPNASSNGGRTAGSTSRTKRSPRT